MLARLVDFVARRLAPTSRTKRSLVSIAMQHLEDVVYARLFERGFNPGGIVDVGACYGEWAKSIRHIFLHAPILMIEARRQEASKLSAVCHAIGNARFSINLLGSTLNPSTLFAVHDTGSSIFPEQSNVARDVIALPMTTLDILMEQHTELHDPLLLKLDVQGAELEVLKGAKRTIGRTEIIQLEMALLPYNAGAPMAAETIAFMDNAGFAMFDILGFIRPSDQHLVQIDVLFARKSSALRPSCFAY